MINGTLNIDLKGTEIVVDEPNGWFTKLLTKLVGKTEYEQESVTQLQYLEKIYGIFSELGWKNIVSLDLNGETVYDDAEYKEDDFKEAINIAYGKIEEKDFKVMIHLENTDDEKEESITVDFDSKHDVGEFPLNVEAELDKTSLEVETFLTDVKAKINEAFGIESGELNVDDDEESDDDEDDTEDSDDEDEEESKTEESDESTEKKEEVIA